MIISCGLLLGHTSFQTFKVFIPNITLFLCFGVLFFCIVSYVNLRLIIYQLLIIYYRSCSNIRCPTTFRKHVYSIISIDTLSIFTLPLLQAFRRLYEQVGLGWVYAITKYEPVSLLKLIWSFIHLFRQKWSHRLFS